MLFQITVRELLLMFVQPVMHLPKFILCPGGFCSFCRLLGMRMHLRNWKITKYETQLVSKMLLYIFDYGIRLSAIGTFVISILNQSYRRFSQPLSMVLLSNGEDQLCIFRLLCSSGHHLLSISPPLHMIRARQERRLHRD